MFDTLSKAQYVYIVCLRNQHAVENQTLAFLERQVGRLEVYPEMSERMRRNIEESRDQTRRLDEHQPICDECFRSSGYDDVHDR